MFILKIILRPSDFPMRRAMVAILTTVIFCAFRIFSKTVLQTVSADKTVCKTVLQKAQIMPVGSIYSALNIRLFRGSRRRQHFLFITRLAACPVFSIA